MFKKLIVILGPTASGKTELAVKIAKKFNGEIISADSRQIYCEMNIGTAKPTQKEMGGIPHHLIDIISPNKIFNVVNYRKLAIKIIKDIQKRDKVPILCGGTGFYIQAIVDGLIIPEIKPDWKLRKKLEEESEEELFKKLKKLDLERAKTIESKNKRRLIRAIEIITITKKPVPRTDKKPLPYPVLILGIKLSEKELEKKVSKRVKKMIKQGLEKEAEDLVKKYGWVPALQTIGYQEWKEYFRGKINKNKVKDLIILHTKQFVKRQMTWFKKDKRIIWVDNYREAKKIINSNL